MTPDSSALIAILFAESGHLDLIDRILVAESVRVAAPTLVETSLVLAGRRRTKGVGEVEALVHELGVTVVPFGEREWHAAVAAFLRFGRGRHAAALNFGDCLAYAAAVVANDALLFVGDDFGLTDVKPASDFRLQTSDF
jgi:ribonuclease VapC